MQQLMARRRAYRVGVVAVGVLASSLATASALYGKSKKHPAMQRAAERVFEISVPKHVPLKIRFVAAKEAAFKKFDNEQWVNDLEIEVMNTGDRPIYFLAFDLDMPEMTPADDRPTMFLMHYGRPDLLLANTQVTAADVPIEPGDQIHLKVREMDIRAWQHFRKVANWQLPAKVTLLLHHLTFGDGTGLDGPEAEPWPPKKKP